jgi:hypothetical protein
MSTPPGYDFHLAIENLKATKDKYETLMDKAYAARDTAIADRDIAITQRNAAVRLAADLRDILDKSGGAAGVIGWAKRWKAVAIKYRENNADIVQDNTNLLAGADRDGFLIARLQAERDALMTQIETIRRMVGWQPAPPPPPNPGFDAQSGLCAAACVTCKCHCDSHTVDVYCNSCGQKCPLTGYTAHNCLGHP